MSSEQALKQIVLFDLDGTLTDSRLGITKSVQYSLRSFDIVVDDLDSLRPFIGPPLYESFMRFYGFSEEQAQAAVQKYREYFSVTGLYENEVYEGIPQLLERLSAEGRRIAIATSKPTVFAIKIAEHFGIAHHFEYIVGSELDGTRIHKGDVIAHALQQLEVTDRRSVVMIGDREHDIIGARENGIDSIGVLFGFGSRQELEQSGALAIAASVSELAQLLG